MTEKQKAWRERFTKQHKIALPPKQTAPSKSWWTSPEDFYANAKTAAARMNAVSTSYEKAIKS